LGSHGGKTTFALVAITSSIACLLSTPAIRNMRNHMIVCLYWLLLTEPGPIYAWRSDKNSRENSLHRYWSGEHGRGVADGLRIGRWYLIWRNSKNWFCLDRSICLREDIKSGYESRGQIYRQSQHVGSISWSPGPTVPEWSRLKESGLLLYIRGDTLMQSWWFLIIIEKDLYNIVICSRQLLTCSGKQSGIKQIYFKYSWLFLRLSWIAVGTS
jgi:hypothetical protein